MKKALLWLEDENRYIEYDLPKGAELVYQPGMDDVACARCGELMNADYMYTSRQIHNHRGFGYFECEACYSEALKRGVRGCTNLNI